MVGVSPEMYRLRGEQDKLNRFLWSTELAYGAVLRSKEQNLLHPDAEVTNALADVEAEAWFPRTMGEPHYKGKISTFMGDLRNNLSYVFCAVILAWYSRFEAYLDERLGPIRRKRGYWGPFTDTLSIPGLLETPNPVQVHTVLRADLCRQVRNWLVHTSSTPLGLPTDARDPRVQEWRRYVATPLLKGGEWNCSDHNKEVDDAVRYVGGEVINQLQHAESRGKQLTPEQFYAIFSFTNFSALAFEIEEALLPAGKPGEKSIFKAGYKIRRRDLVILEPGG